MKVKFISKFIMNVLLALGLCATLVLSACSGGGDVAAVGTGGSGTGETTPVVTATIGQGIVTGFGSVIVDGVEYQNGSASTQSEDANGNLNNADIKLGQRVQLVYDGSLQVSKITLLPQLIGPVSKVANSAGLFQVMGLWVRWVDSSNATAAQPATVVSSYSAIATMLTNDAVEVHGNWVLDSSLNAYVLVATRIEKLATTPMNVLISGVVYGAPTSTQFALNSSSAQVKMSAVPSDLSAGQSVQFWLPLANLEQNPWQVTRLLRASITQQGSESDSFELGGLASDYDAATHTVTIQGTRVTLPSNANIDADDLTQGGYVKVHGRKNGNTLVASSASSHSNSKGSAPTAPINISGITSGIDWNNSPVTFNLRGTKVSIESNLVPASCKNIATNADMFIKLSGTVTSPNAPVQVTSITCSTVGDQSNTHASIERKGLLVSIDTTKKLLNLQTPQGYALVLWDSKTYFKSELSSMVGKMVELEAVSISSSDAANYGAALRAQKVELE